MLCLGLLGAGLECCVPDPPAGAITGDTTGEDPESLASSILALPNRSKEGLRVEFSCRLRIIIRGVPSRGPALSSLEVLSLLRWSGSEVGDSSASSRLLSGVITV